MQLLLNILLIEYSIYDIMIGENK